MNTLLEFEIYHPKDLNEFCDHMELLGYPEFSDYKNSSCDDCHRHLLKIKEDLYSSISNS